MNEFIHFFKDKSGATVIEYGVIAALISLVIIGSLTVMGTSTKSTYSTVATDVNDAGWPAGLSPGAVYSLQRLGGTATSVVNFR